MRSRKGINIWVTLVIFAILYAAVTFGFIKYFKNQAVKSTIEAPLSMLDSVAFKFGLNIDSLRHDSTFTKMLTKDLTEDDIYTKALSYSDDDVIKRFADTTKAGMNDSIPFFPTDSMRNIMAINDITEERLAEYVANNQERFNLLNEKKGLVKEVSTLKKQIDTISTKTESIISDYKTKADSLNIVMKEIAEIKKQGREFNEQEIAKLVKDIEAMKPVPAAKMLEELPDVFVVKLLKKLKNRQAGKILTALSPAKSASLSLLIMQNKSEPEAPVK